MKLFRTLTRMHDPCLQPQAIAEDRKNLAGSSQSSRASVQKSRASFCLTLGGREPTVPVVFPLASPGTANQQSASIVSAWVVVVVALGNDGLATAIAVQLAAIKNVGVLGQGSRYRETKGDGKTGALANAATTDLWIGMPWFSEEVCDSYR